MITRRRKGSGGKLQGGVVSDVESPVRDEPTGLARLEIPIGHGEQIGHFLSACLVLLQPAELAPIL